MDLYLTTQQVAHMLGVTDQTVRDQARSGLLPCAMRQVGTRRHEYRFPRDAIEAMVNRPGLASRASSLSTADVALEMTNRALQDAERELALARAENRDLGRRLQIARDAIAKLLTFDEAPVLGDAG